MDGGACDIVDAAGQPHRVELEYILTQADAARFAFGSEELEGVPQLLVDCGDHGIDPAELSGFRSLECAQTKTPGVLERIVYACKFFLSFVDKVLRQTHSSCSAQGDRHRKGGASLKGRTAPRPK